MHLTPQQQHAITLNKSLAVIASAGTGKTTVLTQRFLNCHLSQNAPLANLLAFTFTEKASREMKERILKSQNIALEQTPFLNISTIHAFCKKLLLRHGSALGLSPDFDVFDETTHELWLNNEIARLLNHRIKSNDEVFLKMVRDYGYQNVMSLLHEMCQVFLPALPEGERTCLNTFPDFDTQTHQEFLHAVNAWQNALMEQKIKNNLLSYDDLELLTLKLMNENTAILKQLQTTYRHIMVDEFQDVSPRQAQLIHLLFDPPHNMLFIVGDPKQSIYRFRQADVELFFNTAGLIQKHGGDLLYLTETFRTPQKIQTWFNTAFSKIFSAHYFRPTQSNCGSEGCITVIPADDEKQKTEAFHQTQAKNILALIQCLISDGVSPAEIALLFYARPVMDIYKTGLEQNNIPLAVEAAHSLFESPLFVTAWHILKYLAGSRDKISQIGILRLGFFTFSEDFIAHLQKSGEDDLFRHQVMDLFAAPKEKESFNRLCGGLKAWSDLSQILTACELFDDIIHRLSENLTLSESLVHEQWKNLFQSLEKQGCMSVEEISPWLEKLEKLNLKQKQFSGNPNGVRLLTVHGAKGLEFEHVFVIPGNRAANTTPLVLHKKHEGFLFKTPDREGKKSLKYRLIEPKEFKNAKDPEQAHDRDEIKRLVYVALTRSKNSLYLLEPPATKKLKQALEKNSEDLSVIASYNDWLYWLCMGNDCVRGRLCEGETLRPCDYAMSLPVAPLPSRAVTPSHRRTLTVTQLHTYHQCPKKFELKYVKNIPPLAQSPSRPVPPSPSPITPAQRGMLFHEILQFYNFKKQDNLDTVVDQALFNQRLVSHKKNFLAETEQFLSKLKNHPVLGNILFNHTASHEEVEFSLKLENFFLNGQIDRVVRIDGGGQKQKHIVIDYKTHRVSSEAEKAELAQRFSFQMACYALVVSKKFNLDAVDALIVFVRRPAAHQTTWRRHDLEKFETELNMLSELLNNNLMTQKFAYPSNTHVCTKCPYFKDNMCGVKDKVA